MKYVELGKKLREIREERNWSLDQLIEKSGLSITKQYVSMAESGKTKLATKHYVRICNALSIDLKELKDCLLIDISNNFDVESNRSNS